MASNKFFLVFGGSGFIGSALVARLTQEGFQGIHLSRSIQKGIHVDHPILKKFIQFDLVTPDVPWLSILEKAIPSLINQAEINVINCAGVFNEKTSVGSNRETTNEIITRHILKACEVLEAKKLIHLSSSSIYASRYPRIGIKEDEVFEQELLDPYAYAKWSSEKLIAEKQKNLPHLQTIILRPQLVYGPKERLFLPQLISQASSFGLPLTSPRGPLTDMTAVENLIDAIILSTLLPHFPKKFALNISDGTPIFLFEELKNICNRLNLPFRSFPLPKKALLNIASAKEALLNIETKMFPKSSRNLSKFGILQACLLSTDRTLDISKARQVLSYSPKIHTAEGLREYALYELHLRRKKIS